MWLAVLIHSLRTVHIVLELGPMMGVVVVMSLGYSFDVACLLLVLT